MMAAAFCRRFPCGDLRERITDTYIIIMLLVFPLFTGFSGYSAITFPKYVFFVSATAAWILALAAATTKARPAFFRPSLGQACAMALMAVGCVSASLSPWSGDAFIGAGRYDGLASLLLYCCIFIGVSAFTRPKRVFFAAFSVSVSLCCTVAILQLFGLDILRLFPEDCSYYDSGVKYTSRFLGTIGNVDVLVSLLCLALPLFFGIFTAGESKRDRLYLLPLFISALVFFAARVSAGMVGLFVCALLGAPLLLSDIRRVRRGLLASSVAAAAAALALSFHGETDGEGFCFSFRFTAYPLLCLMVTAVCLIILLLLILKDDFRPSPRTLRLFFSGASAAVFAAAMIFAYFYNGEEGALYELSQILHGNIDDSFGSHRILIWRETLELVPEYPLFGGGPDTLALRLDIDFSRYVEETGKTLRSYVDNAHNEYLGYLVNTGILGLFAYLSVLAHSFFSLLRRSDSAIWRGLLLAVICYCAQSFFSIGLCLTAPVFWIFLALASSRSHVNEI